MVGFWQNFREWCILLLHSVILKTGTFCLCVPYLRHCWLNFYETYGNEASHWLAWEDRHNLSAVMSVMYNILEAMMSGTSSSTFPSAYYKETYFPLTGPLQLCIFQEGRYERCLLDLVCLTFCATVLVPVVALKLFVLGWTVIMIIQNWAMPCICVWKLIWNDDTCFIFHIFAIILCFLLLRLTVAELIKRKGWHDWQLRSGGCNAEVRARSVENES